MYASVPKPGNLFRSLALGVSLALALTSARADAPRLANLSTRGPVGTGANIMIAGLVLGPGTADTVLIRAVGPGLLNLGVTNVLAAPVLSLYDSKGNLLQSNQGWGNGNATAAIMSAAGALRSIPAAAIRRWLRPCRRAPTPRKSRAPAAARATCSWRCTRWAPRPPPPG